LRNNLTTTKIVVDPAVLCDLLDDEKIEVIGTEQLNEQALLVTTISKAETIVENASSNIVVSIIL
jgi:hypothetical protein